MKVRLGSIALCLPLLVAAVPALASDFTTYGCPAGPPEQLNGITAGTLEAAQICLEAPPNTFAIGALYNVTLHDTLLGTTYTAQNVAPQADTLMLVTVPSNFYATVSVPGQPDPVTVTATIPNNQVHQAPLTSMFQINPPMAGGGPVFISAVNAPVTWVMYSGGTGAYQSEFNGGQTPPGMEQFPELSSIWTGTPSQTGIFVFSVIGTDTWGNEVVPTLTAYIVPNPQANNANPATAVTGSGTVPVTINGNGFVGPVSIPEPGSTVQAVFGNNPPVTLTPTSFSANQLTVNIPANLLTTEGYLMLTVSNLGVATSNTLSFPVNPTITSLGTNIRTAGAPALIMGVTGAGFANGAVVQMNGSPLPTTFVSSTSLTVRIPTIPAPGVETLVVVNPDGTLSAAQNLTVVAAPTISALQPASVNAGSASFALTVTGTHFANGMAVYFNNVALPTTLVQNQQNNMLVASVPAAAVEASGFVPVTVGTADGYYTPNVTFTVIYTGPPPLQLLTFSPLPGGVVNTVYSFTLMASQGAGGYIFSVIGGALPAGLQLSSGGVLSGTPTAVGSAQFIVQVADSAGATVSRNYTLNIAAQPLTLTTGPLANTQVNTPLNIQFAGSGGVPPYTFVEFGALPPGTSISSAGLLSGSPTKAGAYPFLLVMNDTTGASTSKNFTLNVALPGLLITPPSPLPAGQINQPYTTQLAATGGVGTPYVWSATGLPQGLTIANNTGLIAGIPRASGTFQLGITVGDSSGATVTQNYTLVIASTNLTITTGSLANGAVGSAYSFTFTASGGTGADTFAATGLPPGLTLASSGILSGTPTTAGTYTVNVTVTDSTGLTASASLFTTIAAKLTVTPATISNAIVGTAITPVQLTATGGTPPYRWQSATLPPGLSLASNGTVSGAPAAVGTFSSTVFVVDNSAALSSGTLQVTVAAPPTTPPLTLTGLPPSAAPATQPVVTVSLANPYPVTVTVNLTLTFAPVSGADDPSIQFATGGRTAQIVIPAGSTVGLTSVAVQTGTVAGTITITAQLLAGTVNVTPAPAPTQSIVVPAGPPVITGLTATRTSAGFTVTVTGYASNRDVDSATYQFAASEGSSLQTTQVSTTITSLFTQWYGSASSAPYGSQFTMTQPFAVNGSASAILSVTVTLTNALGTSPAASAILH